MEHAAGDPAVRRGPAESPRPWPVGPLALAAVLGGLAAAFLVASGDRGLVAHDEATIRPLRLELDLNTAVPEELSILPGLGPSLAGRIVEHRAAHGPFVSLDGLLDVPGIGPTTLAGLRPHLRVVAPPEAAP